ncbi:hypothetical protein [Noviherbaspirillum pedocola]|uniref:Uncharacterized protein n=1 Tax=Noviherbaspirillum pedocola TaxID=2801341 RepID=A0A934W5Q9_9BURK|nr:hypothetical protein [Noviherbaspirillum pedocola]MBK4734215.1 hypothetical protein [Noviherbaspirillum pedocola]
MRIASLATAVILAFSANVYASYMDSIRARCEAYGSTPGTRDFYQCLHDLTAQEGQLKAHRKLEPLLAGCNSLQAGVMIGHSADEERWDSNSMVTQLSPVSFPGCSPHIQ